MAEKLHHTLDFNAGPIEYPHYIKQVEQLCGERNHLMQLAFDIMDTNNDDKVSELDLFKTMYHMCKNGSDSSDKLFNDVLLKDFNEITRAFKHLKRDYEKKLFVENNFDELYVSRLMAFRNLQAMDRNFDRKKEKIIWPIFECKRGVPIIKGQGRSKQGRQLFGYNRKVFKNIPSVERVNSLTVQEGREGTIMKNQRQQDSESELDSEDEWQNQDFFESSIFWKHQNQKKASALKNPIDQADISKEKRKKKSTGLNSISNNYQNLRVKRKNYSELSKIKPNIDNEYPRNHILYLFDNPIFENYMTSYIEETQGEIQGAVNFEQFRSINFKYGIPHVMVDFLVYMSGQPRVIQQIVGDSVAVQKRTQFRLAHRAATLYQDDLG